MTGRPRKGRNMNLQYRGNGLLFLRNVYLYAAVTAPLLSLCLMGAAWPRLFVGMLLLSLFLVPLAAFLVSRIDGFSLDDAKQAIVRRLGRNIPYASVKVLDINDTSGMLKVSVRQGGLVSFPLSSALARRDKLRLITELRERIPLIEIRVRASADWKVLFAAGLIVVLATAAFHAYLYARHPAIRVLPQQVDWKQGGGGTEKTREYIAGLYSFSLPMRFHYRGREGEVFFFEDAGTKRTEIKVAVKEQAARPFPGPEGYRFVTGMGDYAEALERAYSARFGVIPLVLKGIALSGMSDVRLFEVRYDAFRGSIAQGSKKGTELTHIILAGGAARAEIYFFISGPVRLDEQALQDLVTRIHIRRP